MALPTKPAVFVSSTFYDLRQVRANLEAFISGMGYEPRMSERADFPITPNADTIENCRAVVEHHSDIFVLIIGNRLGSMASGGLTYTQHEYNAARDAGLPIYPFVQKQVRIGLDLWRVNPGSDFSGLVDDVQVFRFAHDVYSEQRWVKEFEVADEIISMLRSGWALLMVSLLTEYRVSKGLFRGSPWPTTNTPSQPVVLDTRDVIRRSLDDSDPDRRMQAVHDIGHSGTNEMFSILADALSHPFRDVRTGAGYWLAMARDTRAIPALIEALQYIEGYIHFKKTGQLDWADILKAFRVMGEITAAPLLNLLASSNAEQDQQRIARVLGVIKSRVAVDHLIHMVDSPTSKETSRAAIESLGMVGGKKAADCIRRILERKIPVSNDLLGCAIRSAMQLKDKASRPALISLTTDDDLSIRRDSIDALASMQNLQILRLLINFLDNDGFRAFAQASLQSHSSIGSKQTATLIKSYLAREISRAQLEKSLRGI